MAVQDLVTQVSLLNQPAFGVDEALSEVEVEQPTPPIPHHLAKVSGLFPPYYDQKAIYEQSDVPGSGALQRMFGKKLIDSNPNEKVFAIAQAYNGFGQYGYFVQTDQRLYFHQCESPKDLHFSIATLQSLGTDDQGNSLDIFGHQLSSPAAPPDLSISCVFDFPIGDKPTPPDTSHAGVDFLIVSIKPANSPNVDARLRARLLCLNSGTPYDGQEVGFYWTQNGCRQDSVPLVGGPDGLYLYPPTNAKNAFLAWGGRALKNTWVSVNSITPQQWTLVGQSTFWQSVNPPAVPSGWVFGNAKSRRDWTGMLDPANVGIVVGQSDSSPYTWWKLLRIVNWRYATTSDMQNSPHGSGDLNGYSRVSGSDQYYQLTRLQGPPSAQLVYNTAAGRLDAWGLQASDIGKVAHQLDNDSYWQLTDMNAHATNTDYREYFLINLNRLFTDFQQAAPASLQFLIRGYWDAANSGSGVVNIIVTSYKNGLVTRTDSIVWGLDASATQKDQKTFNPVNSLRVNYIGEGQPADAKGLNLALITVTMADGTINITAPTPNADGATLCPV